MQIKIKKIIKGCSIFLKIKNKNKNNFFLILFLKLIIVEISYSEL